MAHKFVSISEINSSKSCWSLRAKVLRLWAVKDFNRNTYPFSVEMVLMDSEGGRIHATIRRTLLYKFQKEITEGKVYVFENLDVAANGGNYRTTRHGYKLNFQIGTKIFELSPGAVRGSPFKFVPIPEICGGTYDSDYLVDVVGMLTGVGTERQYERNGKTTKLNVIALEADGHKLQCTLFGNYVDDLNSFLASGDTLNTVVVVQLGKVKTFQDKLHIQNCVDCTKIIFNPTCAEATELRNRMLGNDESPSSLTLSQIAAQQPIDPMQEFMFNTPRSTIQGLKDCFQDAVFVVLGTIEHIVNSENWFYTACVCSKSVYPDSNMFFCEKCNKHVVNVFPRYSIKARVMDDTGSAIFVLFDRDATLLFNKTCAEVLEGMDGAGGVPDEIYSLINSTYLFKVECKAVFSPRFERSFRVKKICNDVVIIKSFKDKWAKEEALFLKNANEMTSLSGLLENGLKGKAVCETNILSEDIVISSAMSSKGKEKVTENVKLSVSQDLLPKFEDVIVDLEQDSTPVAHVGSSVVSSVQTQIVKHVGGNMVAPTEEKVVSSVQTQTAKHVGGKRVSPTEDKVGSSVLTAKHVGGKRVSPTEDKVADLDVPLKLLKRNIKIEKI